MPTSPDNPLPLAAFLREARLKAGLSQAEVARRTGIDASVISKYEASAREPSAGALLRLIRAVGCPDLAHVAEQVSLDKSGVSFGSE